MMLSFPTLTRWGFRLWQARTRERLFRATQASYAYYVGAIPGALDSSYAAFVDRVSPFSELGYKRTPLRKALWAARFPTRWARWTVARLGYRITRSWPDGSSGRFAGYSPEFVMKAEHVYNEQDWTFADGDAGEWLWFGAWLDIDVPWSRDPESWLFVVDGQGFISAYTDTAILTLAHYHEYESEWIRFCDNEISDDVAAIHEEDHYGD